MKTRVLLVLLAVALVSACSRAPLLTAPEQPPMYGGGGWMGSGH